MYGVRLKQCFFMRRENKKRRWGVRIFGSFPLKFPRKAWRFLTLTEKLLEVKLGKGGSIFWLLSVHSMIQ
jgi:hypothetical protein